MLSTSQLLLTENDIIVRKPKEWRLQHRAVVIVFWSQIQVNPENKLLKTTTNLRVGQSSNW